MPRHGVRGRTRPVPRPDGTVPDRGSVARHKLPVHGRLRRPGILLGRNGLAHGNTQGS